MTRETIKLYGCDVDEQELYNAIQEAERSSFRTPAFRECVMLDTETGKLFQASRYGCGSMSRREFDGIDVCLWETMDRQNWQPFGDYFCEGQNNDVINDFVRDVLSPAEWEEVEALAKEEECEPWQAVNYSENSRYYLDELNTAVCDECEEEMLSFLDPWEIIGEIERRAKQEAEWEAEQEEERKACAW